MLVSPFVVVTNVPEFTAQTHGSGATYVTELVQAGVALKYAVTSHAAPSEGISKIE